MHFDIKKAINILTLAGSHSYGMATEKSDLDIRGICTPPKEILLDFEKSFDQYDEKIKLRDYPFRSEVESFIRLKKLNKGLLEEPLDQTIYSLNKFFSLAKKANPNILEILFVDPSDIIYLDDVGHKLISNRHAFLSKKVKFTFSGYAISQLKRIKTHRHWILNPKEKEPKRSDFGLPEHNLLPADQREAAGKLADRFCREWLLLDNDTVGKRNIEEIHNKLEQFIYKVIGIKEDLTPYQLAHIAACKELDMSDDFIAILQAERSYKAAKREYRQYQDWKKNRNPERAAMEEKIGFDSKHASHLVRLMRCCEELLTTGNLWVKRPDAEELLAVRRGAWSYDKIINWAEQMDKRLDYLYKNTTVLPKKPNDRAIRDLYFSCLDKHFQKKS